MLAETGRALQADKQQEVRGKKEGQVKRVPGGSGICALQLPCKPAVQGRPVKEEANMEMQDRTGEDVSRTREGPRQRAKDARAEKNILPVRRLIPTHSKYGCIIGHRHNRVSAVEHSNGADSEIEACNGAQRFVCCWVGFFGFPDSALEVSGRDSRSSPRNGKTRRAKEGGMRDGAEALVETTSQQ